jgi:hypothetical protein
MLKARKTAMLVLLRLKKYLLERSATHNNKENQKYTSARTKMVQLSATRCSCIAILWVSVVSFATITLCVASQRVFLFFILLMTWSGNFWTHPRILINVYDTDTLF